MTVLWIVKYFKDWLFFKNSNNQPIRVHISVGWLLSFDPVMKSIINNLQLVLDFLITG
jgi:hypothetical protein